MKRMAFKMQLMKGQTEEYKRRHDALWPELKQELLAAGVSDYSIFHDEQTDLLIGILRIEDPTQLDRLATRTVMRKWWTYMKDIMETNADDSPVTTALR